MILTDLHTHGFHSQETRTSSTRRTARVGAVPCVPDLGPGGDAPPLAHRGAPDPTEPEHVGWVPIFYGGFDPDGHEVMFEQVATERPICGTALSLR